MTDLPLSGCSVLVTRPAAQADSLCDAIKAAGGRAVRFPVIRVEPRPADVIAGELAALPPPDIVIFVSRNAVEHGVSQFGAFTGDVAAIGRTTANSLAENGLTVSIDPGQGYTSEQLLAHGSLQKLSGRSVLIVRGGEGRPLLGESLAARGASVHYLHVYTREPEAVADAEVAKLDQQWRSDGIDVVSVMSVATFEALVGVLPATSLMFLRKTPLVAPGERVIQTIGKLVPGIPAIQASGPHPEDIVSALVEWRHSGTKQ